MIQNTSPPWPRLVHDAITSLFGKPIRVHSLGGGQSQANVWKVQFPARSVIVKRTKQPRERLFYTTIAPLLREARIPVPHLEWSDVVADDHWLMRATLAHSTTINALIQQFPEWLDHLLLDGTRTQANFGVTAPNSGLRYNKAYKTYYQA